MANSPDRQSVRAVREAAWRLLQQNLRAGTSAWGGRAYQFVCPSPSAYPFQWFWDSCFHAIALSHFDLDLARAELRSLLQAARPDGFIPHMILWERERYAARLAGYNIVLDARSGADGYLTATIQPPVLAQAVERVCNRSGDTAFLAAVLPAVMAYYRWLARERDPDRDGLITIIQPDESGLDASPKYDALLRLGSLDAAGLAESMRVLFDTYQSSRQNLTALLALDAFHVEDVLVNSIYAQGLRALARLCSGPDSREFAQRAGQTEAALLSKCWDEATGAFYDLVGQAEVPARVLTVTSLFPLILETLPAPVAERLIREHLLAADEFWLPYPVPSVARREPSFDATLDHGLIWRGPTWLNTNWFLVHGLRQHGRADLARPIAARSLELAARAGFRECYNPYTGAGLGAEDFAWSTLVVDMMTEDQWLAR